MNEILRHQQAALEEILDMIRDLIHYQDSRLKSAKEHLDKAHELLHPELKQLAEQAQELDMGYGGHHWDDCGERCLKCGDKDWFAGPVCEGKRIMESNND